MLGSSKRLLLVWYGMVWYESDRRTRMRLVHSMALGPAGSLVGRLGGVDVR